MPEIGMFPLADITERLADSGLGGCLFLQPRGLAHGQQQQGQQKPRQAGQDKQSLPRLEVTKAGHIHAAIGHQHRKDGPAADKSRHHAQRRAHGESPTARPSFSRPK